MALIKINGVDIHAPSEYSVGIQDISKAERNANGTIIIERIATKRKIELSWKYLDRASLSTIFNAVADVFFTVEYIDPQDNATKIGTFYCGDRKAGLIDFKNGIPRYKDVSFNLIER
ncbi:MAG: DUF6711 family protein [Blautia sp.]|jgi:hypothetical protein